jgi:hypothetical protein
MEVCIQTSASVLKERLINGHGVLKLPKHIKIGHKNYFT